MDSTPRRGQTERTTCSVATPQVLNLDADRKGDRLIPRNSKHFLDCVRPGMARPSPAAIGRNALELAERVLTALAIINGRGRRRGRAGSEESAESGRISCSRPYNRTA